MNLKYNLFFVALGLSGVSLASAAPAYDELTGFGTGQFTPLAPFGSDSQSETGYSISGSDLGSALYGTLAVPYVLSGTPEIYFTGTLTGANPGSTFQIQLLDADFDGLLYNASWSAFTANQEITLTLAYVSTDLAGGGAFDGTVTTFALLTNGAGSNINFTLNSLKVVSAIPEPSAFAGLVGLAAVGFVSTRRRRSA